jgi:serine phosphatase RsbU (regulator of sigma subunit)
VLPWFAALMTSGAVLLAGLTGYVALRRGASAWLSLCVLLLGVAWWCLSYAIELTVDDLRLKGHWGDLKYLGICALAPSLLVFVLRYTGRGRLVTRRLLVALTVEPVAFLAVLFFPPTHDLVRFYPPGAAQEQLPIPGSGPLFWVHLVYSNVIILVATGIFVVTMVRLSRTYRRMATILVLAAILPWMGNLLYNFGVGWFASHDLTPCAFAVTGVVLVWGLFRERLVNLTPLARGVIVDTMADAVFVLDAFGRITDLNPAGAALLSSSRVELVGLRGQDILAQRVEAGVDEQPSRIGPEGGELTLGVGSNRRTYDLRRQPLSDRTGRAAGELLVLRDVTERVRGEQRLQQLLAERSRVAAALQASLVPAELPEISNAEVASRYEPAGDGSEIGGDFFDVFPLGSHEWGIVLGDVSGKGAEAAAVTALARYTLRTLAYADRPPSRTLAELNARLLASTAVERHCTLVYAVARECEAGLELTLSLAGHHPPLVLRADGRVEPIGRLGTALGLVEDVELFDSRAVLAPGDLLCMFTDGLVEARQGTDLFGSERVAATLSEERDATADDVATALVSAARGFHGHHDLGDDLAILVVRARSTGADAPTALGSAVSALS